MSLEIPSNKYDKIFKNIKDFKDNNNYEFEVRFLGRNFKFANLDVTKFSKALNYFILSKEQGGLGFNYNKKIMLVIRTRN